MGDEDKFHAVCENGRIKLIIKEYTDSKDDAQDIFQRFMQSLKVKEPILCGGKVIGNTIDVDMTEEDGQFCVMLIGEITDPEEVAYYNREIQKDG